jgi:hypothetical protein
LRDCGAGENAGGDGYCTRNISGHRCPQRIGQTTRRQLLSRRNIANSMEPIDLSDD